MTVMITVVQVGMCIFVVLMIKFVRSQLEFQLEDETLMTFDAQTSLDPEDQEQNPCRKFSFPDLLGSLRSAYHNEWLTDVNVMRFATEITEKKLEFSTRVPVNEETDNPMAHSLTSIQ